VAVAVGGVERLADVAELRALAARIAARRSIGVRSGRPGVIDGSIFSTLICVVDNGGGIEGGAEAAWASDCDLTDDSWGVREGVGVMGLSFSDFSVKVFVRGGAEAGTEAGSGSLGRRPVVASRRATLACGRPDDFRHEGTYSSSSFPSSESVEESLFKSSSFPLCLRFVLAGGRVDLGLGVGSVGVVVAEACDADVEGWVDAGARGSGESVDCALLSPFPSLRRTSLGNFSRINLNNSLLTRPLLRTSFSTERTSARIFSTAWPSWVKPSISRFKNIITPIMTNSIGETRRAKAFL